MNVIENTQHCLSIEIDQFVVSISPSPKYVSCCDSYNKTYMVNGCEAIGRKDIRSYLKNINIYNKKIEKEIQPNTLLIPTPHHLIVEGMK